MPDTIRPRLITSGPPRQSWQWALFGAPFLLAGIAIVVFVLTKIADAPAGSSLRTRAYLPIGFGAFFAAMGMAFLGGGLKALAARRRRAREAAAHPDEPWRSDFDWDPHGQRQRPRVDLVGTLVAVVFLSLLLAPLDYWAFAIGSGPVVKALVVLANLLVLWGIAAIATRAVRKLRYGGISIRYGRFPFFLGEQLDVRVATAKPLPAGVPFTARLRFLKEAITTQGGNMVVNYFQDYGEERTVTPDSTGELVIRFTLPEGEHLTDLSRDNRRFWELNLQAKVEGADFDETFLLPIYRRP